MIGTLRTRKSLVKLVPGGQPLLVSVMFCLALGTAKADDRRIETYQSKILPILADFCYECHANGIKKGDLQFDAFADDEAILSETKLWSSVLKNVRLGIMPPLGKPRPSADQIRELETWVKQGVFALDPKNPDPGRVTIRRLNRIEYQNTIRDLMGYDFRAEQEFPPDDSGYGFDNIADALMLSPLLLEKYMKAAETIVTAAVPTFSRQVQSRTIPGSRFRGTNVSGDKMSFYEGSKVNGRFSADSAGTYRLVVELNVRGEFDFDPGKCVVKFKADDNELLRQEFGWENGKRYRFEFTQDWKAGDHPLSFELEPLIPKDQKKNNLDLRIGSVQIEGPLEPEKWARPKNFDRFFLADDPQTPEGRKALATETLRKFAGKAFRRPVEDKVLQRLVAIAEAIYSEPGKSVEQGISRAMIAVLSSPRFLFRVEGSLPKSQDAAFAEIDEYSLAGRLSYFLWSTMPDDELTKLAEKGELRKNLKAQVERMMKDDRSKSLVENFLGQWLQVRDLEGIAIDARVVLARDTGEEKELAEEQEQFRAFLAERDKLRKAQLEAQAQGKEAAPLPGPANRQAARGRFTRLFGKPKVELDGPLRQAMKRETEMFFAGIVREDRSVLDLLDSDYTYVNERLAKFYDLPEVKGEEMRKVQLPEGSSRGGVLTQGTVLVVTSNPTRTSPVKRGLFVLDNILGSPPPPPPAAVPQLEDAEKEFKDREPTLREVLELHRSKPLCNSCHSRMDPLGLALENFNALGMKRETERKLPLDTQGKLVTGETFGEIRELKKILKEKHRTDFYRCFTEKLMTYAIGRGMEYYDVETIDQITRQLEDSGGRFSTLLMGVIDSAPFRKRRETVVKTVSANHETNPTAPRQQD